MSQSKKHSLLESTLNILSGMIISFIIMQYVLIPLLFIEMSYTNNISITLVLTVASIIRSYLFRRLFNRLTK